MLRWISLLLLIGCAGGGSSDKSEPSDDSGGGDTDSGDTSPLGEVDGTCDGYSAGANVAVRDLYSGAIDREVVADAVESWLFETEDDWLSFLAGMSVEGEIPAVDFEASRVAAGVVVVSSTCGLSAGEAEVTQSPGEAVHVDITVTDSSGACDTACSAVGQVMVAVAVGRDGAGPPTVCVRREDAGC